jgi:hypothetical protein
MVEPKPASGWISTCQPYDPSTPASRAINRHKQLGQLCICGETLRLWVYGVELSLFCFRDGAVFIHRGFHLRFFNEMTRLCEYMFVLSPWVYPHFVSSWPRLTSSEALHSIINHKQLLGHFVALHPLPLVTVQIQPSWMSMSSWELSKGACNSQWNKFRALSIELSIQDRVLRCSIDMLWSRIWTCMAWEPGERLMKVVRLLEGDGQTAEMAEFEKASDGQA